MLYKYFYLDGIEPKWQFDFENPKLELYYRNALYSRFPMYIKNANMVFY